MKTRQKSPTPPKARSASEAQGVPSKIRDHTYIPRNLVTNSGRNLLMDQTPSRPLEVQPSTLAETLYSTKDHKIQKIREEREHSPNKDYLEIGNWTYNHSKSRSLNVSVRTQTTEAKVTCHYSDISLQQAMNTPQWKQEKMILKSTL